MKRILLAFSILAAVFLAGCAATQSEMEHSEKMYDKQLTATKAAVPVPIFQMVAQPGQKITLEGVERISVYNPSDATNKVPAYKPPENAGAKMFSEVVGATRDVLLTKMGIGARLADMNRGAADKDLLNSINNSNTFENPFK